MRWTFLALSPIFAYYLTSLVLLQVFKTTTRILACFLKLCCSGTCASQAKTHSPLNVTHGLQFRLSISFPSGGYGLCNQLYPLYQGLSVAEALQADIILPKAYYRLDNYNTSFTTVRYLRNVTRNVIAISYRTQSLGRTGQMGTSFIAYSCAC